jgi:thiosulfate dehydrogenase
MRMQSLALVLVAGIALAGVPDSARADMAPNAPNPAIASQSAVFQPPAKEAIPPGPYGDMVKLGRDVFRETGKYAGAFVGNELRCSNCHLDVGRLADSSPMWAAWVVFPAYRAKNRHVNTFQERLQGCFRFSMNGRAPPFGDKVLVALETYAAWLAQGAPVGTNLPGRGYPRLKAPSLPPDFARGRIVYEQQCALCHGPHGAGQSAGVQVVFPPLWGANSYNWGAGMQEVDVAAGFIRANMPLGLGGTLSDQDAWDVALFVDSHERPQDPRFTGNPGETRLLYHNSRWSMYGQTVAGHVLGSGLTPARDTEQQK